MNKREGGSALVHGNQGWFIWSTTVAWIPRSCLEKHGASQQAQELQCEANMDAKTNDVDRRHGIADWVSRELNLRTAVLVDAVRCLTEPRGKRDRNAYLGALRWVRSHDTTAPFSFENLCDSLGFDPSRLRCALLKFTTGEEETLRPAVRHQRASGSTVGTSLRRPYSHWIRDATSPTGHSP